MLYIMRHGKTDWNERRKLQGITDIPLNDSGRQMAKEAAEEYKDVHFDICFCSPLVRAKETAKILLEGRDVPIVFDDRLKEMGFGTFEGVENCFDIPDSPIKVFFFHPEDYNVPVEGGESLDLVFERVKDFLDETALPLVEAGKDVLIVAHGALNSCIVSTVRKLPREQLWSEGIPNCKLIRLI